MKKVFAIILSVVMLCALAACADSPFAGSELEQIFNDFEMEQPVEVPDEKLRLAGTEWTLTSMEAEGILVDSEFLEELGINGSLTFTDKEVTISAAGESETVQYTVDGNTITMIDNGEEMTATVEGNDIIIDMGADGIMTFTKN